MQTTNLQKLLTKHLPQSQQLLDQLLAVKGNQGTLPKVVVYGVYNSGKSSLLNSLTGHVEQEYFATRDIPETKATKTLEQQGICYVDTPGLDVDEADTCQANAGVDQADILMFVHKLAAGPIQAEEMQTLQQLVSSHGKPEQILAVIVGADAVEQQQGLICDISSQLQQLVPGCTPFLVSNTMFQKGVREGKQPLIHYSAIPQLREALHSQVQQLMHNLAQQREDKQQRLKQQLLEQIAQRKDQLELLIDVEEVKEQVQVDNFVYHVAHLQLLIVQAELQNTLDQLS